MKKFDAHAHIGQTSSGEDVDSIELIKNMDKFGIEVRGISSLSGTNNDKQNELVRSIRDSYPERIKAYAFINPKADDVMKRLDLYLGDYKFDGVKFHPWKHGYYSDNTHQIDDVLDKIEDYGVHVQVHVGTSPLATPYPWIRYAKKHSNIRFVFTHMGCREFGYSVLKAVKDIENIWLETSVIYDRDVITNVKDYVGADRIIFGTDWPYKSTEVEIEKIYKMGLNEQELEKVFYKNIENLWKVN